MILGREPALLLGLIGATLVLAMGFGLDLSKQQLSLIMAFFTTMASVIVRQQVRPMIDDHRIDED